MITNDEQLNQAVDQLTKMYQALTHLRAEVLPINPSRFTLLAEGPRDEIRRLQQEIDAYMDGSAPEEPVGVH
jgi:hypothetical protein